MAEAVLDASAILAWVFEETGAEKVEGVLGGAAVSAVNIAEVATKFLEYGMSDQELRAVIDGLQLEIHSLGREQAYAVGHLREVTRNAGLSLGDRACLSLAKQLDLPVLTADRIWATIADDVGVVVQCIR